MTAIESRVLSVSYGSFSVKLEGFDDPFAIMRRVTEYFRSVAALDPSFGQKPLIEDLSVLEAIETAVFNDDVSLDTQGSTITLRPKESQADLAHDIFKLDNTDLAPVTETATPAENTLLDLGAEQQIALSKTPLDLREMAHNHEEMPFVRTENQRQALEEPIAAPSIDQEQTIDLEATLAKIASASTLQQDITDVLSNESLEIAQPESAPIIETTAVEIVQEMTETVTPRAYRSLSVDDFDPVSAEPTPPVQTAAQIGQESEDEIKALITKFSMTNVADQPVIEERVIETPALELPIVEETIELPKTSELAADLAADLNSQDPVEKNKLRIIRNEYVYEEPEQLEKVAETTPPPAIAVNPFRKFPKRVAEPKATAPVLEEPEDDIIHTYRKLSAEHG